LLGHLAGLAIPAMGALALHKHYKKKRDAAPIADAVLRKADTP